MSDHKEKVKGKSKGKVNWIFADTQLIMKARKNEKYSFWKEGGKLQSINAKSRPPSCILVGSNQEIYLP